MNQYPAFEIIVPGKQHIKIYTDGTVEGMEPGFIIKNRIPAFIDHAFASARSSSCPDIKRKPDDEGLSQGVKG